MKRARNGSIISGTSVKVLMSVLLLAASWAGGFGQAPSPDFKTIPVDKKLSAFPDTFDLTSPLSAWISFSYLQLKGQESRMGTVSSQRIRAYFPSPDKADSPVSEKRRAAYLNTLVNEVIVYKDSVACVVSHPSEDDYSLRYMSREDGRWLNAGEDMGQSVDECRKAFAGKAELFYGFMKRIPVLARVPDDAAPFARYLKAQGRNPQAFMRDALARHPLVIYGEIHRRQWSWNFLRSVISDRAFAASAGTIYMEISAHKQGDLDAFLAKETMDPELVLDAFREVQTEGWPDKGMYEFLLEVWKINRSLPAAQRIKVIAADIPRPLGTFRTAEEQRSYFDRVMNRNQFMAETIERDIRSGRDARHRLFIVGTGHVYKSLPPGFASSASATQIPSAGALLSSRLPRGDVYAVFSHQPIVSNNGDIPGRLRGGVFDEAFAQSGDRPAAFDIAGSPFGLEPFDALPEVSYHPSAGTYADNYDGYVFLGPLADEPADYLLYELYSPDFVKELSRRATMENSTLQKWFGVEAATPEAIIAQAKKDHEGKKRWGSLPPLKTAKSGR